MHALLFLLLFLLPAQREDFLVWTNQSRLDQGVAALRYDGLLTRVAQERADQIAGDGIFSHCPPALECGGGMPAAIAFLTAAGPLTARHYNENIAALAGRDAADLPRLTTGLWLASPEHRAALLDRANRAVGFGIARYTGPLVMPAGTVTGAWWILVQEFHS